MQKIFNHKVTFKKLFLFALPNIIMMTFMSLYVCIDGIFVARNVGPLALGAINIAYPVISLMYGISIMFSVGAGALISKKLGQGLKKEANANFMLIIILQLIISLVFVIIGLFFSEGVIDLLASEASELQKSLAVDYLQIALYFAPVLFLYVSFQTFFVTSGNPLLGMIVGLSAGVTNIALDYLFIVEFNMGIEGAALATALGQSIPALVGVIYFTLTRKGLIKFCKPNFSLKTITKSATNGSSEMLSNLSNAITTFLFNFYFLKFYGDDGVSAITIILYFQFIIIGIFFGYTNGVVPLISYKNGEGKHHEVSKVLKISLKFITITSIVIFGVSLLIDSYIIDFFADENANVADIANSGVLLYSISFLFVGFSIFITGFFTALNDGLTSGVIATLRTLVFLSLSIIVLSFFFDGMGAFVSISVAEVLGLVVAITLLKLRFINKRNIQTV